MKKVSLVKENGFSSSGSNLWNVANRHQATQNHIKNYTAYKLVGNVDVACAIDEARQREVARHNHNASRYSKMLEHHIDVATFLAAQGLAFRGHDESRLSANRGNFLELLDVLGNYSYDLRSFLNNDKVTYTSHDPQNQFIECIYAEVRLELQNRMKLSKFISVMMDDTSDNSNVEQSAVSVRFVHNGEVVEHMLGLIDSSKDQSANNLSDILFKTLESYDITSVNSKEKVIGQSYDGAPTMSGELNGVQKQVRDVFPAAYYSHCVAHRMSLCASQSSMKIAKVAKFFGTCDKLVSFFRSSPKRAHILGRNMPKPGDTRWLSRDTATAAVDAFYDDIGNVLYNIANDSNEKSETQATARGLGMQMQEVEFVYFLKLYRRIFDYCSPIITVMQNPTLDPVQLAEMLDDFQKTLRDFDFESIWKDTLLVDPDFPAVRTKEGWRQLEQGIDGSHDNWRLSLEDVAKQVINAFLEQICWRFENVKNFKWMDLIHPSKFEERKQASSTQQRELINDLQKLYPFAVPDVIATENNLHVLYHNTAIATLLQKGIRERDAIVAKKKKRKQMLARQAERAAAAETIPAEGAVMHTEQAAVINANEATTVEQREKNDEFEVERNENIDFEVVKEGSATIQDLRLVIKKAELEEALPHVVTLLDLAATTPLTSVHCERIFSRMRRVVAPSRSTMKQNRKEKLLFLQVEHKLLREIAANPNFKRNAISRFSSYNERRLDRFSRK